jgi:hypothetical protein
MIKRGRRGNGRTGKSGGKRENETSNQRKMGGGGAKGP